jgi:hypothetical protein
MKMAIKKLGNYGSDDFVVRTLSEDLSLGCYSKRTKTNCIKTTLPQKNKIKRFTFFYLVRVSVESKVRVAGSHVQLSILYRKNFCNNSILLSIFFLYYYYLFKMQKKGFEKSWGLYAFFHANLGLTGALHNLRWLAHGPNN